MNDKALKQQRNRIKKKGTLYFLTFDAYKLKLESFIKSLAISLSIFLLIAICIQKNFGIVHLISNSTNSNHFFTIFVIGNLI